MKALCIVLGVVLMAAGMLVSVLPDKQRLLIVAGGAVLELVGLFVIKAKQDNTSIRTR